MTNIFFSKDIQNVMQAKFPLGFGSNSLIIYHSMYCKPEIPGTIIEWEKYRIQYSNFETEKIILIGLNRMITPSNRCDFVHDYLTTLTPNIPKIIFDTSPFIGEPWRLFFHYLFANCNKFGVNYSYPIEGEWQKWFSYTTNNCRLSANNLNLFISNTWSDLNMLTTEFETYIPNDSDINWYNEVKNSVFENFISYKTTIAKLLKLANTKFNLNIDFESYLTNKKFTAPAIGIYQFVIEENKRRLDIYNCFCNIRT